MKKTLVLFVMVALLMAGSHSFAQKHGYVDLGLPSGTLWATCNVGANAPEEYGNHFAWGEIKTKSVYNWYNYKYCNGDYDHLTKYNVDSELGHQGFTDGRTTLKPEDDAATANWGSGWCMPTKEQWEELEQYTTSKWTTRNGVYGRLFTASNGRSLFLPAAGFCMGSELIYAGKGSHYWSLSLDTKYTHHAWCVSFDSDNFIVGSINRDYGLFIRPVRSSH